MQEGDLYFQPDLERMAFLCSIVLNHYFKQYYKFLYIYICHLHKLCGFQESLIFKKYCSKQDILTQKTEKHMKIGNLLPARHTNVLPKETKPQVTS